MQEPRDLVIFIFSIDEICEIKLLQKTNYDSGLDFQNLLMQQPSDNL